MSDLVRAQDEDRDRLNDAELVSLVWQLVLGGQTPTNLLTNAVLALLTHPAQLTGLRADPGRMPGAVEELMRWCGPQLLAIPRHSRHDVELHGVRIAEGNLVTAAIVAANRDPRVFTDPDSLDLARATGPAGHLGFAHGPHFCLGASVARVQTQVALAALLSRIPRLRLAADDVTHVPDADTWRLASLPVAL